MYLAARHWAAQEDGGAGEEEEEEGEEAVGEAEVDQKQRAGLPSLQ